MQNLDEFLEIIFLKFGLYLLSSKLYFNSEKKLNPCNFSTMGEKFSLNLFANTNKILLGIVGSVVSNNLFSKLISIYICKYI